MNNPFLEAQARAGVPDVDSLLAEREKLARDHAQLFALYSDNAKFADSQRKRVLSKVMLRIRDEQLTKGEKVTEKVLDALAHADAEYVAHEEAAFIDRCRFVAVEDRYKAMNDRINRGNNVLKFVTMEPR